MKKRKNKEMRKIRRPRCRWERKDGGIGRRRR